MSAAPPESLFYGARDALLALHGALAIALLATSTAHVLETVRLARARLARAGIEKRLAPVVAALFVTTFCIGAALYPTYRVHARAAFLEQHAFGIVELFDVKESYAALALIVALGLAPVSAALRKEDDPVLYRVHAAASALVCGVAWFDAIAGLVVWSTRGLG